MTTSVVKSEKIIVGNSKKVIRGKVVGNKSDNHCGFVEDIEKMLNEKAFSDLVGYASSAQRPLIDVHNVRDGVCSP